MSKLTEKMAASPEDPAFRTVENTASGRIILLRDIGILLFVFSVGAQAVSTVLMDESHAGENVVMLAGIMLAGMLAAMHARAASAAVTGLWILGFSAYELYGYFAGHANIAVEAFFEPVLLLMAAGGMLLFSREEGKTDEVIRTLNRQVDELTIIDPLTRLENMKSLKSTLTRQMAIGVRTHTAGFGLLLIRLRYQEEIRKILTDAQFQEIRVRIAEICTNTLRIEDRVFTTDKYGSIAVIYFSDQAGAPRVKERLMENLTAEGAFPRIGDATLKLEFQIVYKQYDETLKEDAFLFLEKAEAEFAYEV